MIHVCKGSDCESWTDARTRMIGASATDESNFVAGWHIHAERTDALASPLRDAVAQLQALGQKYDALGGYSDKDAEIAWNRQVTARWKEACAALDAIVPGASDAMFFGVSNSDDMDRKVRSEMSDMR